MTTSVRSFVAGATACLACAASTAALAALPPTPAPDDPGPALAGVKQSPNAKIGPWLDGAYAEYREARGRGVTDSEFRSKNKLLRITQGRIAIQAMATNGPALVRSLRAMGATAIEARGPL